VFIPKGLTDKEVTDIINKVVNSLASTFRFGYYDTDDMKQQGWLFAMEALERFDTTLSYTLDQFLYRHVRNRFINFKRDNYSRNDPPCLTCPFYDPNYKISLNQCGQFTNKLDCDKWEAYKARNTSKQNIVAPIDIMNVDDERENNMMTTVEPYDIIKNQEIRKIIDTELDMSLKADFLRMMDGVSVSKTKRLKIIEAIINIMEKYGD
jgi:DNA-directed RNA polymerase specialized sigma24 family protein